MIKDVKISKTYKEADKKKVETITAGHGVYDRSKGTVILTEKPEITTAGGQKISNQKMIYRLTEKQKVSTPESK